MKTNDKTFKVFIYSGFGVTFPIVVVAVAMLLSGYHISSETKFWLWLIAAVSFLVMEFLGWLTGRDLPPNLTQMGIWFGGAVFTLATGKSIVEKNLGHEPDVKGEDDGRDDKV